VPDEGARPFDAADRYRIAEAGPPLIAAVRGHVTAGPLVPSARRLPPGMLVVGPDGKVKSRTPQAQRWLEPMFEQRAVPDWLVECSVAGLAFEAQPLGEAGDVAIMIQQATGTLLVPTFCDWYQITARERQIMHLLQDGRAPKQIARRLDVSVHTINEHLKAIYRKTGAGGRHDLMAAITG
jgi:DNA-binding CsgD family transcriptional regulator